MQCPICQHEMVPSKVGSLCHNCGHFEPASADQAAAPAKITLGRTPTSAAATSEPTPEPEPAPAAAPVEAAPPAEPAPSPTPEPPADPKPEPVPDPPEKPPATLPISSPLSTVVPPAQPTLPPPPVSDAAAVKPEPAPIALANLPTAGVPALLDRATPEPVVAPSLAPPTPPPGTSVMPGVADASDPSLAPDPVTGTASSVMPGLPTSTTVSPAAGRKKWLAPLIAVVVVLVLGGGALAYKAFVYDPQQAPAAYLEKLFNAKTGQFSATASYSTPSDASSFITGTAALTASGSYDVTNPQTPESDVKLAVKYSGSSLGGEIITLPKTAYFRITQLGFLSSLGFSVPNSWYSYPIPSESGGSSSSCTTTKHTKSGSLFGFSFPTSLPLKHAARDGLFTTVDGHRTTHYSGDIDMSKLPSYVNAANAQLPADCKVTLDASTVKNTAVHYDIWRGSDFDRANFAITTTNPNSTIDLTLDSGSYNQPVNITAPADAKSLESLLNSFEQDDTSSGSPAGFDSTPTNSD